MAVTSCPCADASLCASLDPAKAKIKEKAGGVEYGWEVLAFSRTCDWSNFSWDLTTTVAMDMRSPCTVGEENVCLAHSHGARVVWLSDEEVEFTNATARASLVAQLVNTTKSLGLDGVNLDIERYSGDRDALTQYVRELGSGLRAAIPGAQLSFDLAIAPLSQNTSYDHRALAEVTDFLVPMAYDENWGSVTPKANCPLSGLLQGLEQYHELGVCMSQLVVALPWYSTSWPCNNSTPGAKCVTDLKGRPWNAVVSQPRESSSVQRIGVQNISAVSLQSKSMTKLVEWVDDRTLPPGKSLRHVDMFDDAETIGTKVAALRAKATQLGIQLGGVGTFCAGYISDESRKQQDEMWRALGPNATAVERYLMI